MPPNQNQFPAPMPPNGSDPGHDPYAFFMDPQRQPKKSLFGGGASNNKLFIITGGIVAFLVLIVFLVSLSAGGNKNSQQLMSLAQAQQEVIRVANDGTKNASSSELKNFAMTTVVSVSSDQRLLLEQFAKNGKKIKPKDLQQGRNLQTDQALAAAQAANTYDSTFASTMDSELRNYQNKLTETSQVSGPDSQLVLKHEIDNAAKLRKELQAHLPATP